MLDLINSNYKWIWWVKLIDSWKKWPSIWISVCTHWWEHAWLKALEYIYKNFKIEEELIKWKVYFILTNKKAYKKSLKEWNKQPVKYRFIEENLNRCCDKEDFKNSSSYEVKRALELENVLKDLDYHLDIHSTYSPSEAMLITTKKWWKISGIFNVDTISSWIPEVQVWKPFIDITERNWWIWIWLEAWYEKDETWFKIWVENFLRLLNYLWMLDWKKIKEYLSNNKSNIELDVYDSIIYEWEWFKPIKNFKHKDIVKKWEIITIYNWKEIRAKKDSYILMPWLNAIWEEYCFLAKNNTLNK